MSDTRLIETDFSALFGIEFADGAAVPSAQTESPLCRKCHGRGNFIGWSGRVVGKCFACTGTGLAMSAPTGAAISVEAIATAFAAARAKGIKSPRLRLADFMFSRAPDHGANAGSIYVKRGDEYLGKVTAGAFHAARGCGDETKALVIEVAAKPHDAAKAYGLRTGNCSCCGRELTNGISIDLGIGPICREKYGWG